MPKIYGNTLTTPLNPSLFGGGGSIAIDQTYNPSSANAQSGKAIHKILGDLPTESPGSEFINLIDHINKLIQMCRNEASGKDRELEAQLEALAEIVEGLGESSVNVDQTYNPESANAQSGKAVAELDAANKRYVDDIVGDIETLLRGI